MPTRMADAIWWQVHPLDFVGAEPTALPAGEVRHRLAHLQRWLDHLLGLGCNALGCSALALGPVFASGTHGYDTVDHFRVDPRPGRGRPRRPDRRGARARHPGAGGAPPGW
ncbi:hypothetical protein [Geodermatophilus sp. URMC 60]